MATGRFPTTSNSPLTAKGDLFTYSTSSARLGVGTDGQILTADSTQTTGIKWATAASSSKFGQLISTFKSDTFTAAANNTWTDVTGMSVSITPTATTSKVLVQVTMQGDGNYGDSAAGWQILRGSTAIGIGDAGLSNQIQAGAGSYTGNTNSANSIVMTYLDSPSTTSSTTYKVQGRSLGGNNIYVNRTQGNANNNGYARFASTITVTEILV
jgi:hypothetical protein